MHSITICIATYKRPLMLEHLIKSISKCNIDESLIKDVAIVVVDNDINKTAQQIIIELNGQISDKFKLHYFNEPAKGIANVRNELIKKAFHFDPDYLIFIDDDEYTTSEWLNELVKTIINNNSDAVRGPVFAVLDKTVSRYISCWFERENYPDSTRLYNLKTGNLILRCTSLKKYNVWFDSRFNIIGSSDSYFGIQILKKGAKINWSAKAVTYETIPKERANLKWLIKRIYRYASTYTYVLKLEKEYVKLSKKILVSFVYLVIGICSTILMIIPFKRRYWGILKFANGLGGLAGLGNLLYKEYK